MQLSIQGVGKQYSAKFWGLKDYASCPPACRSRSATAG